MEKNKSATGDNGDCDLSMIERLHRRSKRIHRSNSSDDVESLSMIERLRRRRCSNRIQKKSTLAASEFMQSVSDDLLLEIFFRFPNSLSVIRCAAVCKRWRSLVLEAFISRYIHNHRVKQSLDDPSDMPAYTSAVIFNYTHQNLPPFHQLSPKYLNSNPYRLNFLPDCGNMVVRASWGELLLLSRGIRNYYVCNPLTRQWLAVPEGPLYRFQQITRPHNGFLGYALVFDPKEKENLHRYRVVLIWRSFFFSRNYNFFFSMFDSETGVWAQHKLTIPFRMCNTLCPTVNLEVAATSDGVLHWLVFNPMYQRRKRHEYEFVGVIAFDVFAFEYRMIPLPAGRFSGIDTVHVRHKLRLGVVRGRLWLSLMREIDEARFRLKVWELDSDDSWALVHNVVLRKTGNCSLLCVLAFDPCNGDVVYLVRDRKIFSYKFGLDKYEKVCDFPCHNEPIDTVKQRIALSLKVFTLVHPLWPKRHPILHD